MLQSFIGGRRRVFTLLGSVSVMVALVLAVIGPPMAVGQASRTWVSGVGDDVNPCSRTAPCKTFAGAISKTATGGEINCLDPAGFGAVTITKSLTIDCTGTLGGILASSTTGIIINGAGAEVNLRGLEINGGPPTLPGVNGVRILQASAVHIFDTTISNFKAVAPNGNGIIMNHTSTSIELSVTNSYIHDNGTASSGAGILIAPSGTGTANVVLNGVSVENNFQGVVADGSASTGAAVNFVLLNSVVAGNASHGVLGTTTASHAGVGGLIDGTSISANVGNGVRAVGTAASGLGSAILRVGNSVIALNFVGIGFSAPGAVRSFSNNEVNGNVSGEAFSGNDPLK